MPIPIRSLVFAVFTSAVVAQGDDATDAVPGPWEFVRSKYDANEDGVVRSGEYPRGARAFGHLDRDADGKIDATDFESARRKRVRQPTQMDGIQWFFESSRR